MTSPEYKTMLICGETLSSKISSSFILNLAEELKAKNLIPPLILSEMTLPALTDEIKASKLVSALTMKIDSFPKKFKVMVETLEEYPFLSDMVDLLWSTYEENGGIRESTSASVKSTPSHQGHEGIEDHFAITSLLQDMDNDDMIELGMALGLFHSSLTRMSVMPGDMVIAWLCRQDAVIEISDPSWASLTTALKKTGHSSIAAIIGREKMHAVKDPPSSPLHTPLTVASSALGMADLIEVTSLIKDLTCEEMIQLGVALGLSDVRLRRMKMFPEDIIAAWLTSKDAVLEVSGPPSWANLTTALNKTGHSSIATIIEREKLNAVKDPPSSPLHTPLTVTSSPIGMEDHFMVTSLLRDMCKDDIIRLGVALGLSFFALKRMSTMPEDMIQAWLDQRDTVIEMSGPPSWASLATALDKTDHSDIATRIRRYADKDLPSSP